jgi:hypothetical protein
LNLSRKKIAGSIKQDEGNPTSVQYLNVLEHRRHGAPQDQMIVQLATFLRLEPDAQRFSFSALRREPDRSTKS